MELALFGLGYVGIVTAACLAERGHRIHCYDTAHHKTDALKNGEAPVYEPFLQETLERVNENNLLLAAATEAEALETAEAVIITVGTPSDDHGDLKTDFLTSATVAIAETLASRDKPLTIIFRSTMFPGILESLLMPILARKSGKILGKDYFVYYYPEFMREGSAISDYDEASRIIIGCINPSEPLSDQLLSLFSEDERHKIMVTQFKNAEFIKYIDNSWHAVKISFANEIGVLAKQFGANGHQAMDLFKADDKLNISTAYLTPGFAFGGSCLPKELRLIEYLCENNQLELPMLRSILPSNNAHIQRAVELIHQLEKRKVSLYGLTFKEKTKDLRESPYLRVLEQLLTEEYQVQSFDELLQEDVGRPSFDHIADAGDHERITKTFVENFEQLVEHSEIVVLFHRPPEQERLALQNHQDLIVIDCACACPELAISGNYYTIV